MANKGSVSSSRVAADLTEDERFWAKVRVDGMCWVRAAPGYYGRFEGQASHRWVYKRMCGQIPDGLQIDHRCNNPSCVKPSHLQLVTPNENANLSVMRGRKVRMHPEPTNSYAAKAHYRQLIEYLAGRIRSGDIAYGSTLTLPAKDEFPLHVTAAGWRATCSWLIDYGLARRVDGVDLACFVSQDLR